MSRSVGILSLSFQISDRFLAVGYEMQRRVKTAGFESFAQQECIVGIIFRYQNMRARCKDGSGKVLRNPNRVGELRIHSPLPLMETGNEGNWGIHPILALNGGPEQPAPRFRSNSDRLAATELSSGIFAQ